MATESRRFRTRCIRGHLPEAKCRDPQPTTFGALIFHKIITKSRRPSTCCERVTVYRRRPLIVIFIIFYYFSRNSDTVFIMNSFGTVQVVGRTRSTPKRFGRTTDFSCTRPIVLCSSDWPQTRHPMEAVFNSIQFRRRFQRITTAAGNRSLTKGLVRNFFVSRSMVVGFFCFLGCRTNVTNYSNCTTVNKWFNIFLHNFQIHELFYKRSK
jgi:hypothetical protein